MYNNNGNNSGNCKANTPAPVYPWSVNSSQEQNTTAAASSMTLLLSRNNRPLQQQQLSPQGTPNSLMDSIISSKTITNYNNRIQCRLAASMAGLKELDNLREKHRKLVQEVKNLIHFPTNDLCQNSTNSYGDPSQMRSPSPAPSAAELSSNISHRSSLSMDSGCLSLASDAASFSHQYTLSADSNAGGYFSLPPSRKNSNSTCNNYPQSVVNNNVMGGHHMVIDHSDDEGCYMDHQAVLNYAPQCYGSSLAASVGTLTPTADVIASGSMASGGATIPKAMFGYRRRGLLQNRPKSLYSYPEENTVLVGGGNGDEDPEVAAVAPVPAAAASTLLLNRPRINRACSVQWSAGFQTGSGRTAAANPPTDRNSVYRANRVYISPASAAASYSPQPQQHSLPHALSAGSLLRFGGRRSRPTSVAVPPNMTFNPLPPTAADDLWRHNGSGGGGSGGGGRQQIAGGGFTWEQVKRMLDPAFDTRSSTSTTSTMVRHHSTVGINHRGGILDFFAALDNNSTIGRSDHCGNSSMSRSSQDHCSPSTTIGRSGHCSNCANATRCCVGGGGGGGGGGSSSTTTTTTTTASENGGGSHVMVSRSVSSQSTDSNKSSRKKEKPWRESEQL